MDARANTNGTSRTGAGDRTLADTPAGAAVTADADRLSARFDAWLALTGQAAPEGPVRLPMLSGSMSPALPVGCLLEIAPAPGVRARPGDVVVLARDGRLVAHRVLLRVGWGRRGWLLEMGDANRRAHWRPATDVVGAVRGARTAAGETVPDPCSRRSAWRGLRRHLRHWLAGARDDEPPEARDGADRHAV